MTKQYEFKIKKDNEPWETTPIWMTIREFNDANANETARTLAARAVREVRWNEVGSFQGHYVTSSLFDTMSNDQIESEVYKTSQSLDEIRYLYAQHAVSKTTHDFCLNAAIARIKEIHTFQFRREQFAREAKF